jgi:hypothetical protein
MNAWPAKSPDGNIQSECAFMSRPATILYGRGLDSTTSHDLRSRQASLWVRAGCVEGCGTSMVQKQKIRKARSIAKMGFV